MIYPLALDFAADGVPVTVTCRALGFSTQAFYKWKKQPVMQRDWDDAHIIQAARPSMRTIQHSATASSPTSYPTAVSPRARTGSRGCARKNASGRCLEEAQPEPKSRTGGPRPSRGPPAHRTDRGRAVAEGQSPKTPQTMATCISARSRTCGRTG
jgi:hypothetical protein